MNSFTRLIKKVVVASAMIVVALSAWSQGNIFFANDPFSTGGQVDAPVFCWDGTRLSGPGFRAQLWARAAGATTPLQAIGASVGFLTGAGFEGYWSPIARQIPGVPIGSQAEVVARVWSLADGDTWEDAVNAAGGYGESLPINVTLTLLPARMVGLQSFVACVPEPSTIAFALLGSLGTLLLRRRRE